MEDGAINLSPRLQKNPLIRDKNNKIWSVGLPLPKPYHGSRSGASVWHTYWRKRHWPRVTVEWDDSHYKPLHCLYLKNTASVMYECNYNVGWEQLFL